MSASQEDYLPNAELCITLQNGSYCPESQPLWSAQRNQCFGTSLLTVQNATHALWQMHCQEDPVDVYQDTVWLIHNDRAGCSIADMPEQAPILEPSGGRVATPKS